MTSAPPPRIKGRGASSNREGRFESTRHEREDDGWTPEPDALAPARSPTQVTEEIAREILSSNDSPDIPFEQSVNPYRGCEHGCIYCYARPTHAYLNLSAGLDFETKLFAKTNAAERLRHALRRRGYRPKAINLGANTDPYQPIERQYRITREILALMVETRHACTIVTKNALVERDIDLLTDLARDQLVHVFLSITTLDNHLASRMEPRASAPHRRLAALARLHEAGVPVSVLVAPIIPAVNDAELERILEAARDAGARTASYSTIRLPLEIATLFREWLITHVPDRADHVISLIRQMHGGRDYDANFATRMRGSGVFAELIRRRFRVARDRLGLGQRAAVMLDESRFQPPVAQGPQADLFA